LGGGNHNGHFTVARLDELDAAVNAGQLAGYAGICYDIEEGDGGMIPAYAASFANAKARGFEVMVTVSHSQPYGVPDAAELMTAVLADPNVDYHSPQIYTSGTEPGNDFVWVGTPWTAYASAVGKVVPAVVDGSRDYDHARSTFATYGVTTHGFVQWAQV
jgi:hypothetical protein